MKNPGFYTDLHLDCTHHYIEKYCGPVPPVWTPENLVLRFGALGALIVFGTLLVLSIVVFARIKRRINRDLGDDRGNWRKVREHPQDAAAEKFGGLACIAGFLVFVSAMMFIGSFQRTVVAHHQEEAFFGLLPERTNDRGTNFDKYEHAASLDGYRERVQAWLKHEYGITVNAAAVGIMQNKGQVAVTYNGKQVAIEFMTAGDGGLAVRQTGGQVLEPTH